MQENDELKVQVVENDEPEQTVENNEKITEVSSDANASVLELEEQKKPCFCSDGNATVRFSLIQTELTRMFGLLNEKFFSGEIDTPVITIQTGRNGPKQVSWSSSKPVWNADGSEASTYFEIALGGEFMNRPAEDIILSLFKEMVHVWNAQHGIKDTSRGKTWHNRNFKETAEEHGLLVEKNDKYGYSDISFGPELNEFVKGNVKNDIFNLYWTNPGPDSDDDDDADDIDAELGECLPPEDGEKGKKKKAKKKKTPEQEAAEEELRQWTKEMKKAIKNSEDGEINVAKIAAGLSNRSMDEANENTSSRAKIMGKAIGQTLEQLEHDDENEGPAGIYTGDAFGNGAPREDVFTPTGGKTPTNDEEDGDPFKVEEIEIPDEIKEKVSAPTIKDALPYLYFCGDCELALRSTKELREDRCPVCGGYLQPQFDL